MRFGRPAFDGGGRVRERPGYSACANHRLRSRSSIARSRWPRSTPTWWMLANSQCRQKPTPSNALVNVDLREQSRTPGPPLARMPRSAAPRARYSSSCRGSVGRQAAMSFSVWVDAVAVLSFGTRRHQSLEPSVHTDVARNLVAPRLFDRDLPCADCIEVAMVMAIEEFGELVGFLRAARSLRAIFSAARRRETCATRKPSSSADILRPDAVQRSYQSANCAKVLHAIKALLKGVSGGQAEQAAEPAFNPFHGNGPRQLVLVPTRCLA